jgi:hypothetical protein
MPALIRRCPSIRDQREFVPSTDQSRASEAERREKVDDCTQCNKIVLWFGPALGTAQSLAEVLRDLVPGFEGDGDLAASCALTCVLTLGSKERFKKPRCGLVLLIALATVANRALARVGFAGAGRHCACWPPFLGQGPAGRIPLSALRFANRTLPAPCTCLPCQRTDLLRRSDSGKPGCRTPEVNSTDP